MGLSMAALALLANAADAVRTSVIATDPRTGRLIRKWIAEPATQQTQETYRENKALRDLIDRVAAENQVEAPLVHSVIRTESGYNPLAVSNKGAQGLMQLLPATAKRFGVKDSFDSQDNVQGGVKYLKYLIDLFHGDYERAVAAYNAGETAVAKYGGVPPYKETQNYVAQVAKGLETERRAVSAKPAVRLPAADSPGETSNPVVASVTADGRVFYRTP